MWSGIEKIDSRNGKELKAEICFVLERKSGHFLGMKPVGVRNFADFWTIEHFRGIKKVAPVKFFPRSPTSLGRKPVRDTFWACPASSGAFSEIVGRHPFWVNGIWYPYTSGPGVVGCPGGNADRDPLVNSHE